MDGGQSIFINKTFTDFDELAAETKGWDVELTKLDAGDFNASIQQKVMPGFIASHICCQSRLKCVGAQPPGLRCFAIPARPDDSFLWRGKRVSGNNLLVFPANGEQDAFSATGFEMYSFSIVERELLQVADSLHIRNVRERLNSSEIFTCERRDLERLISLSRTHLLRKDLFPFMIYEVMIELIQLVTSGTNADIRYVHKKRNRIIEATEDAVYSSTEIPPSVGEICRSLGVSERTLQYAFSEIYQVTPKSYINAVRLNAVYRELKHSTHANQKVSDVANNWGFWHMGQFAADYRKLFRELPSETLGR